MKAEEERRLEEEGERAGSARSLSRGSDIGVDRQEKERVLES